MQNYYWFRKYKIGMDIIIKSFKWIIILISILIIIQLFNLITNIITYVQLLK